MSAMASPDPRAEHTAVRTRAGVIDRRDHGVLEVTGRDRATFLHALLSNEVKGLAPGQGCAATLLDVHGKVQVVLLVWVLDDRILLVTPPGRAAATLEALDHYLFAEKAMLEEATGSLAMLMLAGPEASRLAERLAGARVSDTAWSHVDGVFGTTPVRLVRGGGGTGEAGGWLPPPAPPRPPPLGPG